MMRELQEAEVDNVDGGIWAAVGIALTIYGAADIAYDVYKGFSAGYGSTSHFQ